MLLFSNRPLAKRLFAVVFLTLAINVILISIPGYYSHDELDWLNRIRTHNYKWGFGLADIEHSTFYRPLGAALASIALRLPMQPFASHAALVFVQSLSCCALYLLVRDFRPDRAFAAALLFAAMPGTAFAAGWIAAFFDVLFTFFVMCSLYAAAAFWRRGHWGWAVASTLAYLAGLLSKEPALTAPLAALILLYCDRARADFRRVAVLWASIAAVTLLYAALRIPVLMRVGGTNANGGYTFGNLDNIARNALAYFVFPFVVPNYEIGGILNHGLAIVGLAVALHLVLLGVLWMRCGKTAPALYLAAYFLPLLPVLVISKYETQYIYAALAATSVALAFAWKGRSMSSYAIVGLGILAILHGLFIQKRMYPACAKRARCKPPPLFCLL